MLAKPYLKVNRNDMLLARIIVSPRGLVAAERATKGADRVVLKGKIAGGLERSDRIK
jgi:hypothetical protein